MTEFYNILMGNVKLFLLNILDFSYKSYYNATYLNLIQFKYMLDPKLQTKDYLELIEYSNLLLYWLTANIEDNKNLPEETQKKLLLEINHLTFISERAKATDSPERFLYFQTMFMLEVNTLFDVSDETSNNLLHILLKTLKVRFNNLSRQHNYKLLFESSENTKNDAIYTIIDDFSEKTWQRHIADQSKISSYEETLCIPAFFLSYASWASQNITTGLLVSSALVLLNACNPVTATLIAFSLSFTLFSTNYELIYKNLSSFFIRFGASKNENTNFHNPLNAIKNIILIACSVAAASTIVCFAGTMPATIPYLNLILGITSAISYSIFFYQDLSHLLSFDNIREKINSLYAFLFIKPFNQKSLALGIFNFFLNSLYVAAQFALCYFTGQAIFNYSKDVLLNHYALNFFNISTYTQDLFLSFSMIGLLSIELSKILQISTNISRYINDTATTIKNKNEHTLKTEDLKAFVKNIIDKTSNEPSTPLSKGRAEQNFDPSPSMLCSQVSSVSCSRAEDLSNQFISEIEEMGNKIDDENEITSTSIKKSIMEILNEFEPVGCFQFFGYNVNKRFAQFVASNIEPETNKNANALTKGLLAHLEPSSGVKLLDMLKLMVEILTDSGPIEHDLFNKLKFKN